MPWGWLYSGEDVSIGAPLLFGRTESLRLYVPTHEAAFHVLRGLDVEVDDFFNDPLFRLAEEMFSHFRARATPKRPPCGCVQADGNRGADRAGHQQDVR